MSDLPPAASPGPGSPEFMGRLREGLKPAPAEVQKYAPPSVRNMVMPNDNITRIADFLIKCTWREVEIIAEGCKAESKNLIEWAEGIVNGGDQGGAHDRRAHHE